MALADADLVARVRQCGDPNAFGELVRRYQSPVRAFLARLTRGDQAVADDLAQETFVRAWQNLSRFRGESRFSTWLFGIAMNQFRQRRRRERRHSPPPIEAAVTEAEPVAATPRPGVGLDLAEALERLPLAERAAVVLCCQYGLTHEEAAQALDCPLGTVKTNILRGREKLRYWLTR